MENMRLLGYALFENGKMVKNKIYQTYAQAEAEAKSQHKWKKLILFRGLPQNGPFEADIREIWSKKL